jgi:hypothetical protein
MKWIMYSLMQSSWLITYGSPLWTLKLVFDIKIILSPTSNPCANKDISRWISEQPHMLTWASQQAHASMKESLGIFHVTSWSVPPKKFHVEIIYDVAKYSMLCHGILCHITCMICCGINNDLLTLNMDLTNIDGRNEFNSYWIIPHYYNNKFALHMHTFTIFAYIFNTFNSTIH